MPRSSLPTLLVAAAASACHSYSPDPVDLQAHAREFAARLPAATDLQALGANAAVARTFELVDGVDQAEGRLLAVLLHPDCRLARQRAGVADVARDQAGRWVDPTLGGDFQRILETVPHPWLAALDLGITLPLSGRLGRERDLAAARHAKTLADARLVEARAQDRLDGAWARWSADHQRVSLLEDLVERLRDLESIAARLAQAQELTQQGARAFTLERLHRESELHLARATAAGGELELKRLMGLHPDAPVRLLPLLAVPAHVPDPGERQRRLFDGPRLLPLLRAHEEAERALALAVARQWPDLVLRPGYAEEDAQPRLAFGFSLPLPLFSGQDAEIRTAEAERDLAAQALRCGFEDVVQELAAADLRLRAAEQQQEIVDLQLLPLSEQQVEDGRRLAELGHLEPLMLLDSLVRAHAARILAIDARLARADATVAINSLFWNEAWPTGAAEETR